MLDNTLIPVLIGSLLTVLTTLLGRALIFKREFKKAESDQLRSNSDIIQSHSKTISDLQSILSKMVIDYAATTEKLSLLRKENDNLENKLDDLQDRISHLELENAKVKEENITLKLTIEKLKK